MADNDALEALQAQQALQASQPQPQAQPAQAVPTAPAPPPIMQDQPWQAAPNAQPEYMPGSTEQPQGKGGVSLMDYGKQAWTSWLNTVDGGLGTASFAARKLGASPDTVAHIEQMRRNTEQSVADTVSSMSPDAQKAAHASIFGGDTDGSGEHVPTPGEVGWARYMGMTAASFVPDALMAIVPGGIAGRLGMKIAGEVGAKVASTAATGAAFGTVQAGDAYEGFVKDIDNSKPADWQGNPLMNHMLEQGMSFNDAKKQIVGQAANHLVAMQAGIGAAMGAGGASILMKGPMAVAAKGFLSRLGLSAAEGAATMGGGAGAGEYANQSALQNVGLQKDLDTSAIARASASGALGGVVLGAVGGLLHGGEPAAKAAPEHEETAEAGADTSTIDAATQLALQNHLNPEQPLQIGYDAKTPVQPGQSTPNPVNVSNAAARPDIQATPPAAAPTAEQQLPTTQPGNAAPPAQAAAGPRPSDGMKVGELRDALKTMPGQDPKALARMSKTDLAASYDKAQATQVKPEPASDIQAQVNAVADPNNPKNAAFIAQGSPAPAQMPEGVIAQARPEGTLVTTDPNKAQQFAAGDHTDEKMADLLGYQETKASAQASGHPTVVQGKDAQGNVVHEEAVSPKNVEPAMKTAQAAVPGGQVTTTTPEDALARRETRDEEVQKTAQEAAQTPAPAPQVEAPAGPKQTVSARLKAKQQMAAGVRQKGEAYVAPEGETSTTGVDRDVRTHAEAMQDLRDAVGKVKVTPIKGVEVDRVMNTVMREITATLGKTKTEGDIHEAVAKWAAQPGKIAGSTMQRADVGDQVMKMLTGKTASEFAGKGDRVAGEIDKEMRSQPQVFESEQGTPAELTTVGEGSRELPTKHGDKLPAVLDHVLQGTMDVHEAQDEIGTQKPGPGRPREHATFSDYLAATIKRSEKLRDDPAEQDALRQRIIDHETTQYPTPQAKKAAGEKLNHELRISDATTIETMKEKLAELDPAKAAVENEVARNRAAATRTPEFKQWFGDSKVVDAEGQPLRVYHGTRADFDAFSHDHAGSKTDGGFLGEAFYFGSEKTASTYAGRKQGGHVMPVFLAMKKPLRLEEEGRLATTAVRDKLGLPRDASPAEVTREAKAQGYDGIILGPKEKPLEYAVFEPTQIKSAIGNRGTFDPSDPKVLHRVPDKTGAEMRTPEFNRVVDEKLADGQPHSAKEHLEAIATDPEVNHVAPQMASLARRLSTMVKDIPVEIERSGNAGGFTYAEGGTPGEGRIGVNPNPIAGGRVETVVHESIHAVTAHYLDSLPENHPDRLALDAIGKELTAALNDQRDTLSPAGGAMVEYAASDPHETLTMAMSNPRVQQVMANARPSIGFRMQMLKLGYPLQAAKNMWAAFTSFVRRAMGLKGMATPADASLLDYALRPMTDIIERANEFNNTQFDTVPGLREVSHALPNFQDAKDMAADAGLDRKTLDNKKMKLALPWATSDGMVEWNEKTFQKGDGTNPLREWRDAYESVTKAGKDFRDTHQDDVQDWVNDVAKLKGDQRDKLANLLVDVSTADKKVGPGLTDDAKLQARYDALAPDAKKLYDQSRTIQNAMYAAKRSAELEGMLKGVMPGAPKAQLDAVRAVVKTKASLDAYLADPNNHADFGTNGPYKSVASLVKGIAKIQNMGFVKGDYFPLQRDGDFVIHYGDKDTPDYGMEAFHSVAAAEARRAELAQKGTQDLSPVMSKRTNHLRNMIDSTAIDEIAAAMQRNGHSTADVNDMRDLLASVVMQHAARSEGMRSKLRRQGVLGASKDIEKVVQRGFDATADHVGYAKNGPDLSQALQRMQDHTDHLGNAGDGEGQRTAQAVTNEAQLRRPTGDDGTSMVSKLLRRASPFGYMQSLGSLSTLFTHTTEAHMNAIPLLGARHGAGRASAELARALTDTLPATGLGVKNAIKSMTKGLKNSDYSLATAVRDRLIAKGMPKAHATALFDSLSNAGLIDHTFARELKRIATNSQSVLGKAGLTGWWGRFMDATGAMSHAVDVANKSAIATAAFRMEFKRTGDVDAATRYATDMARKAMPNYNQGNAARIGTAAGPLKGMAGPMMQFKKYGLHMYSMMGSLMHTWMHGATPAEQREARNAFVGILMTHTVAAGGLTLIGDPLRWIGGAYDMLMSPDGKPRDREADIRQVASDWFGPTLGELMTRGAIETFAGQSVHQRIGLSNLLEPPELPSFDKKGFAEAGMSMLTGASGEDAATMAQGFMKMLHGDVMGGLVDTIPRFFRDPLKAYNLSQKGVTDSTGKTILPPDKLSPMDLADQAVGFTPSRVADFRAGRYAVQQEKSENSARRTALIQGWLKADPDDKADAKDDIDAWNHGHPGEKITVASLLKEQEAQKKAARQPPGSFGLKMSKGQTRDLQGVGSFANYQ